MTRLVLLAALLSCAACGTVTSPADDAAVPADAAVDAVPLPDGAEVADAGVDAEPPVEPPPPGSAVQEAVEFVGGAGSLQAGGYQVDVTIGHAIDPTAVSGGNIRVESGAPQSAH
jgi:hypothetical protein